MSYQEILGVNTWIRNWCVRFQSWMTAFGEHIAYSGHYLWAGASPDTAREATEDLEDECKPLGQ
jgi:hypothetical protein